jgi:hypothetical protein
VVVCQTPDAARRARRHPVRTKLDHFRQVTIPNGGSFDHRAAGDPFKV